MTEETKQRINQCMTNNNMFIMGMEKDLIQIISQLNYQVSVNNAVFRESGEDSEVYKLAKNFITKLNVLNENKQHNRMLELMLSFA